MAGMTGISGTPSVATNTELSAAYQVAAVKKQVEATRQIGNAALTLIQSAVIDQGVGQNINITA